MISRRHILSRIGLGSLAALVASVAQRARARDAHEGHAMPAMPAPAPAEATPAGSARQPASSPAAGYTPVRTLNGWTLPHRMKDGVKEFHLVAEEVRARIRARQRREVLGLQRQHAGPDDRGGGRRPRAHLRDQPPARAHHDPLARPATAERHGRRGRPEPAAHPARRDLRLRVHAAPARHPHVPPARRRDGAAGRRHDGHVHHPSAKAGEPRPIDRDYCFLLHNWALHPGTYRPDPSIMTEFDLWTFNSKVFPGDRAAGGAHGRARAHPRRQPVACRTPDPPARRAVPRHRRRRRALAASIAGAPR